MRVALAGKIAGKARKSPPTPGPNFLAMMPATAVINPPKRKRTKNSYHRVFPRAEGSISIRMGRLPYPCVPNPECQQGPNWQGENGHPKSADFAMHQHPTHAGRIG